MQYPLCRHIKANGTRCQAPSLTSAVWCYFHDRLHRRHATARPTKPAARAHLDACQHIQLFPLEDRESVQIALVINALAAGLLDPRLATTILYGLQLASKNVAKLHHSPYAPDAVRTVDTTPEGLDLAELGATLEIIGDDSSEEEDY